MALRLLTPAEVTSAFLKMGLLGFQGSGKTKTSAIVAIGLVQLAKELRLPYADKPVAFLDTETGSDWVIPDFKAAGVPLVVKKTRSFADLLAVTDEAQSECSVMIADSVTHFWKELCDSYCKKKAQDLRKQSYRLQFQDWAYLKGRWAEFTDRFVNSNLHMIICGRAGFEYDYFQDDDGTKQLEKTGLKMKAEGEFGFEPSLLVHMELVQKVEGKSVTEVSREAHIIKDRSTLIDGKTFINPKFKDFLPHIKLLNLGGRHLGVDTTRNSEHAVTTEKKDWSSTQRRVVLDEIQTLMLEFHPSTSVADKQAKIALMRKHFRDEEIVWTKIEEMLPLVDLRLAYDSMFRELKGRPSQYAGLFETKNTTTDIDDSLPEHSAPPVVVAKPSLEQLLAELPNLATMKDCLHFAAQTLEMDHLTPDEVEKVNLACMSRQSAILKEARKPAEEGDKPEPEKEGGSAPKGNGARKARDKATSSAAVPSAVG